MRETCRVLYGEGGYDGCGIATQADKRFYVCLNTSATRWIVTGNHEHTGCYVTSSKHWTERYQQSMKTYMCVICGFVYAEAAGRPEDGITPGTRWEDVPETWFCPDCGAQKGDFDMVEIV